MEEQAAALALGQACTQAVPVKVAQEQDPMSHCTNQKPLNTQPKYDPKPEWKSTATLDPALAKSKIRRAILARTRSAEGDSTSKPNPIPAKAKIRQAILAKARLANPALAASSEFMFMHMRSNPRKRKVEIIEAPDLPGFRQILPRPKLVRTEPVQSPLQELASLSVALTNHKTKSNEKTAPKGSKALELPSDTKHAGECPPPASSAPKANSQGASHSGQGLLDKQPSRAAQPEPVSELPSVKSKRLAPLLPLKPEGTKSEFLGPLVTLPISPSFFDRITKPEIFRLFGTSDPVAILEQAFDIACAEQVRARD